MEPAEPELPVRFPHLLLKRIDGLKICTKWLNINRKDDYVAKSSSNMKFYDENMELTSSWHFTKLHK